MRNYLGISLFTLLFGVIYEIFSHQVYVPAMYLAFLIPLVGGFGASVLFDLLETRLTCLPSKRKSSGAAGALWDMGICCLTLGSLMLGILQIYGTTNRMILVYWCGAGILLTAAILAYFWEHD